RSRLDHHSFPTRRSSDLVGTHAEENNLQPAARFGRDDRRRIAECGDVQLSIARGQRGARDVQRRLSFVGRKSTKERRRWTSRAPDRKSTRLNSSHVAISY